MKKCDLIKDVNGWWLQTTDGHCTLMDALTETDAHLEAREEGFEVRSVAEIMPEGSTAPWKGLLLLLLASLITSCCAEGVDFYPCVFHTPIKDANGNIVHHKDNSRDGYYYRQ